MAYDLLIKNGMVVDGTGAPARQADVAITGGSIAEIGRVSGGAATVIDADEAIIIQPPTAGGYGKPEG